MFRPFRLVMTPLTSFGLLLAGCGDLPPPTDFPSPSAKVGFSPGPKLEDPRYLHASVELADGRVLVSGGYPADGGEALRSTEVFKPGADTWTNSPESPHARFAHELALLDDDTVLAMGGQNQQEFLDSADVFDVSIGWKNTNSMTSPRISFTATPLKGGSKVLVAGGTGASYPTKYELFDAYTRKWLPVESPDLRVRSFHATAQLEGGDILLIGGSGEQQVTGVVNALDVVDRYDFNDKKWLPAGKLGVPRRDHTATTLAHDHVVVVGGTMWGSNEVLRSVEIYDPETTEWKKGPDLTEERTGHTATLLPGNRRLLVAGGYRVNKTEEGEEQAVPLTSGEILDIDTMEWSPAGNLVSPRFWHTAHLLKTDGRVLFIGGIAGFIDGKPAMLDSTEIFTPPCASHIECVSGHRCALEGVCVPDTLQSN